MHDLNADHMANKLEDTLPVIKQVSEQFKNPVCLLPILFLMVDMDAFSLCTGVVELYEHVRVLRFQKCPFLSLPKRSKIFSSTLAFSFRFHQSTLKRLKTIKATRSWHFTCVNITAPSAILDRCSDLDWNQ